MLAAMDQVRSTVSASGQRTGHFSDFWGPLNALMRFGSKGSKVQFVIRAGIGFQGVNHDSRFTPDGGTEREGPKSGFAFDMVGSLGGELDARLGKNRHIGASLTGGMVVGHMLRKSALLGSVESSVHLGYEWSR